MALTKQQRAQLRAERQQLAQQEGTLKDRYRWALSAGYLAATGNHEPPPGVLPALREFQAQLQPIERRRQELEFAEQGVDPREIERIEREVQKMERENAELQRKIQEGENDYGYVMAVISDLRQNPQRGK